MLTYIALRQHAYSGSTKLPRYCCNRLLISYLNTLVNISDFLDYMYGGCYIQLRYDAKLIPVHTFLHAVMYCRLYREFVVYYTALYYRTTARLEAEGMFWV